ncbi:RAxF-45 family protein [Paenibacillus woosongensis]|uniref:RAxF-45 family protein n=1 Tax=Paenibacillus woosongensis TaxID=307580 RepID=UPI0012D99966|nr:RAxF-45 family protein [Paenibacillus woosongensis]
MDRKFAWNRISQLPMALFGIFYGVADNGISLSIFSYSISKLHLRNAAPTLT